MTSEGAKCDDASKLQEASEGELCGICFTRIHPIDNPRGRLNSCNHCFCSYCIKEWAQSTNVCPHCKARFTRIFTLDAAGNEEVKKVRRQNYKVWEEEEDSEDRTAILASNFLLCNICGESDNALRMILCDRRQCSNTVHLDCIHLTERPEEFFCPECILLRAPVTAATPTTPAPASLSLTSSSTTEGVNDVGRNEPASSGPAQEEVNKTDNSVVMTSSIQVTVSPVVQRGEEIELHSEEHVEEEPRQSSAVVEKSCIKSTLQMNTAPCETRNSGGGGRGEGSYSFPSDDSELHRSAEAAMQQFLQRQEQQKYQTRLRRERQTEDPLYDFALVQTAARRYNKRPHCNSNVSSSRAEMNTLLNPDVRRREEESLARRLALEMLPILRRNRAIQENRLSLGDGGKILAASSQPASEMERRERELYMHAMTEGRRMARERMEGKLAEIRLRKERLIRVQAQREAVALAKLARIVSSHRGAAPQGN